MEVDKILICRLCFAICKTDFENITGTTKQMLNFLPDLDLDISDEPVMCTSCADSLKEYRDFKIKCLHKKSDTSVKVEDIKPIVHLNAEHAPVAANCSNVCRCCMELIKCETPLLIKIEGNNVTMMLEKYFPEYILNGTVDSICTACYVSLQNLLAFISNCLAIEETIKEYCNVEGRNIKGHVELSSVLHFMSKNKLWNISSSFNPVKVEEDGEDSENEDKAKVKVEDLIKVEEPGIYYIGKEDTDIKVEQDDGNRFDPVQAMYRPDQQLFLFTQNSTVESIELKSETCTKQIKREDDLLSHFQPSEVTVYKCEICTFETTYKKNLHCHKLTHKNKSDITLFKCRVCTYQSKYKHALPRHMRVHKSPSEVTMYKCDLCTFESKYSRNLRRHVVTHKSTTLKPTVLKCDICRYQTKRRYNLSRHMLNHKGTSEVTIFNCEICTYQNKCKYKLSRHMNTHKSTHEGQSAPALPHQNTSKAIMHKCDLCEYQTKRRNNLSKHVVTHKHPVEIKMYKCETCAYQSSHKGNVAAHMLVHKGPSEVPMYKCEMCTYQTKRKRDLPRHMLTHKSTSELTLNKCAVCSFETRHKWNLQLHTLVHKSSLEITMHKCGLCMYQSKRKCGLRRHMLTHKTQIKSDSDEGNVYTLD